MQQVYGCYELRDKAVQHAIPEFDPRHDKAKIVLPENLLAEATLNIFSAVVVKPDGRQIRRRLNVTELRQIVAASNMKQRVRMTRLYYEAELRNFSVVGTANKNEHDLGFFVKYGDGGVDVLPLKHLLKTLHRFSFHNLRIWNGLCNSRETIVSRRDFHQKNHRVESGIGF